MRPAAHVVLVILTAELALLASQFQVGCDGSCSGFRALVAALTLPLVLVWLALTVWGAVRLVRARRQRTGASRHTGA